MRKLANFAHKQSSVLFSVLAIIVLLVNSFASPLQVSFVQAAGTSCVTSGPASGTYTVTPCISVPADGASVSGDQTVTATYTTTGTNPGVARVVFYLGGQYLITDFQSPYTFTLPSTKFVDGVYALEVETLMKDGFTSQRASISVTFNNGITTPPVNPNTFTPTSGTTPPAGQPFTLVASGDGAGGLTNYSNVTNLINSWNPNMFLYLGDVYNKGTATEFYNWYGSSSTFLGRFRSITNPIVGNHEYEFGVAPGYFDYWDNIPNYYSYDAAGWHFIALNSNCSVLKNCAVGQAQYNWLLNDLTTHTNACTIAYFHHPPFNVGPEGYSTAMNDMWSLLAQYGVDIAFAGHDHDYQRWTPLDGNGVPSSTGVTEFVLGAGGHGTQQFVATDSRMVVGFDTSPYAFGALRLQLNQDGASFQYINTQGIVLDSGSIPCSGTPADTTAPTAPGNLTATTHSATQADLSWTGSTDNAGVSGYDLYRDGSLLTTIGVVTSYSDTNLTQGTTYTYQLKARDSAGNTSGFSNSAAVTMPQLLFTDGFESGTLNAWTSSTNLTVQQDQRYSGVYAARQTSTGTAQSSASKTLSTTMTDLYYSLRFKIISQGTTSAYLQRFRTSTNASIMGVFVSGSTGKLGYRNDIAATSVTTGPVVTQGAWHELQTHVQINGASSLVEVWYDGTQVATLSNTESLGTNPIGRIQLGDTTTTNVYDIALDEVGFNTSYIDGTDSQSPTTPTGVNANATAPNSVDLFWNAATDNVNVTGYDIYRNGALDATVGNVTSYTDTPVSPDFTYQYQVRARDAAGNLSGLSDAASVTTPADTTNPIVSLTAPTDGITVNGNIILSADATDNVDVEDVDFLVNGTVVGTVGEGGPYSLLWDSTTVPDGTVAVITARAVDTSGNTTLSDSRSVTVNNGGGDTLPPTVPGNFTASAGGATRADLSWNASTDNFGVTGYDVYRDGSLLTSVGAVTNYSDASVEQGASYSYQVQARDAVGNVSGLTNAVSVTIPAALFTDGFESGDLSKWTNNGLIVQQQEVLDGAYAARGTSNGTAAIYAYKSLSTTQTNLYYTTWFKVISQGATSAYLQRFRTSTNGAILGVYISSTGKLGYRNDVASASTTSTTSVSQGMWHELQTHVKINGTSSQIEVWLDGNPVSALTKTDSLGSTPIGRVQLGDSSATDIFDIAFDKVAFDTSFVNASSYPPADTTPPTVTLTAPIDSAAVGGMVTLSADATDDVSIGHVDFLVNGSVVGTDATSPYSFGWNSASDSDGSKTVTARAVDTSNNQSTSAVTINVDNTAPDTSITASPTALSNNTSPSFSFTSTEANSTFQCSLDGAAFSACTSPTAYSLLANGAHTFNARAVDVAGNTDATPASWTWSIDATAPTITSVTPLDGATGVLQTTDVIAVFSEDMDPASITATTFVMRTKQGNNPVGATVSYDPLTRRATLHPTTSLAALTAYRATVRGTTVGVKDLAGNALAADQAWTFTTGAMDTTPPTVTLTAPSNGASVKGTVTLSASASDNVSVASVAFLVNGTVVGTDTTSPYSFGWDSTSVADGSSVTIAARATDTSNLTTTTSPITVTVDNTAPDTSITSGPSGSVTSTSASFSFTATESASFACSLDGAAFSACSSPQSYSNLASGSHAFQVRATDTAGNTDATPASQSWTIILAPDTSITAGPTGVVNSTSASFSFTSTIAGSTFTCSLDGASFSACTSPQAYSGLTNGSHTFLVAATFQGATDATPASRTWTVDTVAPTGVAITSPSNASTVTGQVTINATATDSVGIASVTFYADGQSLGSDTSAPFSTTWNTNKFKSGTTHTLYVIAQDTAGNTTQSATITVTIR